MKKVTALLLALMLALTAGCTAALAEEDNSVPPSTPEMKKYESIWVSADGNTRVWIGRQDEGFQIEAMQWTGNDTFTGWGYLANFNKETNSLTDVLGMKEEHKIIDDRDEVVEGSSVEGIRASFTFDEGSGALIWKEEQEGGVDVSLLRIGNFAGCYVYERAMLDFVWNVHENDYSILLSWGESAFQTWEYQLKGTYHPETETVEFKGLKQLLTYNEGGEIDTSAKVEESEVEGTCYFNENGGLVWKASDVAGEDVVFEKEDLALWELEM